jgi:hypothetical protein
MTALTMALPSVLWSLVLAWFSWIVYIVYDRRARINRLRKAGYVSLFTYHSRMLLTFS